MADVEITHDEVRGIDINQVASMQLKDGTVVVVNSEATAEAGDYQDEAEFAQEEVDQVEYDQAGQEEVDQANELRARPMVGMPYGGVRPAVPVRPAVVPMRPAVVPMRPAVVPMRPPVVAPKPVPRGPVVRPGMPMGGVVFRARPGMPVRPVVPVRPAVVPVRPAVVPMRPAFVPMRPPVVAPKPVPRGPVVRPGMPMGGVVFRARPGMPVHMPPQKMVFAPKPVVPVRPGVPAMRPVVPGPMMPKPVPVRPAVVPTRPVVPGPKPLVNQMITAPRYRARPNYNEEEDFQEEYAGEEDYCECDDYEGAEEENQLRARPLVVPAPMTYAPGVARPPVHHLPHRPPFVAPPRVTPVPVKRGPAVVRPGYNTFQPGVFRARPRMMVAARPAVRPMMTPVVPGYGVGRVVRPMPPPPRPYGFGMGPVFRSRPETAEQDYDEEYAEEYDAEGCDYNQSCVCTKCGKEF
jgi:hypothetical protein